MTLTAADYGFHPIDPNAPRAANLTLVAAPTGVAATDLANIQGAIDAAPNGGLVILNAGDYNLGNGEIAIGKRLHLQGLGGGDPYCLSAPTRLLSTSTGWRAITVNAMGVRLTGFLVANTARLLPGGPVPTAGAGIYVQTGDGLQMTDVAVEGFWTCVHIENGAEWRMAGCRLYGPVKYGLLIRNTAAPDSGDMAITDTWITGYRYDADAALRFESGGGLKMSTVKVNTHAAYQTVGRFAHAVDINLAATTSDILMDDSCSWESVRGSMFRYRNQSADAELRNIIIRGEWAPYNGQDTRIIDIAPEHGTWPVTNVSIGGNFLHEFGQGTGVYLRNAESVEIMGTFHNLGRSWDIAGCSKVRLPAPESVWLPATAFASGFGGLALGEYQRHPAFRLPAAGFTALTATVPPVVAHWNVYAVDVWWTNTAAAAGGVVFRYDRDDLAPGLTISAGGLYGADAVTATAAAQDVVTVTNLVTRTGPGTDVLTNVRVLRLGDDAADTLAADVAVLGVMFRKVN